MDQDISINKVREIFEVGSNFRIESSMDLNKGIHHVFQLIQDAYLLFTTESFPTSTFLAITIIEEVAKLSLGPYFIRKTEKPIRSDPLRNHKTKHIVGANYTISMGTRLQMAIGQDEMEKIFEYAQLGDLIRIREASLYCDYSDDKFTIPADNVDRNLARALLLFAIESFDDNLVGRTQYSLEVSDITDKIFHKLADNSTNQENQKIPG